MRRRYASGTFLTWAAQHGSKRIYRSRWQAWRKCWRIWVRQLHVDDLHPYECTWWNDYSRGRTNQPHWHIGHDRYRRTVRRRIWYWRHRLAVWPYYRLRARLRNPGHFKGRGLRTRLWLGFGWQVLGPLDVFVGPLAGWPELD